MKTSKSITQIGLLAAVFLVIGNMLGSGVFMLPSVLATIGGISLFGWIVVLFGVLALALVFAKLATKLPNGAGPYFYAREAFGDFIGFQTSYVYILACWISNVSMLSVITGYLENFFPILHNPINTLFLQILIIIIFTLLNIKGAKVVSITQSGALILAVVPILFLATFGWIWFDSKIFLESWNVQQYSLITVISGSLNNIMWAFIGVESACIAASLVKNAKHNVPIATIVGVISAAILYVLTCTVIMGIVPNAELAQSSAPFAVALSRIYGAFASDIVSLCAVLSCLGALCGWTLVIAQMSCASANDGLFPKVFAKTNQKGVPSIGLIILAIAMIVVVIVTISPTASEQFNKIITMAVILYLIPYIYSGFAILVISKNLTFMQYLINYILAGVAILFCMWSIFSSNAHYVALAFIIMLSSGFFYPKKAN